MDNDAGDSIAGGCCLCITGALQAYCNTKAFGGNGCCGSGNTTAGCCGSCCDDSFNEDSFDKHMAKSGAEPKASQLAPAGEMTVPVSAGGDTKDA